MALAYSDNESGRDYASGSKLAVQTGAVVDFESGSSHKIAGTTMTSNAAELNALDGLDTDFAFLIPSAPAFTIGAEGGNVINVAVQLKDGKSVNLTTRRMLDCWLSSDAEGDDITGTAPDGNIVIGTNGVILHEDVTDKFFVVHTNATGQFDFDIGEASTGTWYLIVVLNNKSYPSAAITFV